MRVKTIHRSNFDIYTTDVDLKLSANYAACPDYEAKVKRLCNKLKVASVLWAQPIGYPDPQLLDTHIEYRLAVPPSQIAGYVNEQTWRAYVLQECELNSWNDYHKSAPQESWVKVSVLLKTPIEKESYLEECRRWRWKAGEWSYDVISCPWKKR